VNKSTFSVSFLALDPESYFAAIRAQQLGIDASEFRSELHNALLQLYERLGKYPEVEIRLYDDFPTQICFIIDEDIYNIYKKSFSAIIKATSMADDE
jgi:hypothetical protein